MATKKKINVTQVLERLQKRLRLQDWDLQLHVVGPSAMRAGEVGNCSFDLRNRLAEINILHPAHNHEGKKFQDIELTLAHELVHIIVNPLFGEAKTDMELDLQEQAVEQLARAIVGV